MVAVKPSLAALVLWAAPALADQAPAVINPPESATVQQGLDAFARIYEVVSHPRCANCHVGDSNIPMWYGGAGEPPAQPHGMRINADESRMGVETLICGTCHATADSFSDTANAPPRAGLAWQLAPVEFTWFGQSPAQICAQMSDPERNGGRDYMGLAEHLVDDAGHMGFVLWGWNPGPGRAPAPYSLQAHVDDVLIWGVAGQPCPQVAP